MENEPAPSSPPKSTPERHKLAAWLPISRAGAFRWLRGVFWIAVAIGCFRVVEITLFPWLVARELNSTLKSLGFESPTFTVREVTLSRAVIVNIGGDATDPHIDAAVIQYSPLSILHGDLTAIDFTGAKVIYDLSQPNGGIDEHAAPSNGAPSAELPFGQIGFQSSNLILRRGNRDYWLPISGVITNTGQRKLKLDISAPGYGSTMKLQGDYDTATSAADLQLHADQLDLAALAAIYNGLGGKSYRVLGQLDLDVKFHRDTTGADFQISAAPKQISAIFDIGQHHLLIDNCTGTIAATLDAKGQPSAESAAGHVDSISFDDDAIQDARFSAGPIPAGAIASSQPAQAGTESVQFNFSAARFSLPSAQLAINNLTMALNISMSPANASYHFNFLPGSHIAAAGVNFRDWNLEPADSASGIITIDASHAAATFASSNSGAMWNANLPVDITLHKTNVSTPTMNLPDIDGELHLTAGADSTGFSVAMQPQSAINVPTIVITGADSQPVFDAAPGPIGITGTFTQQQAKPALDAYIHLQKAAAHLAAGNIVVKEITGDFPIWINESPAGTNASFTMAGISIDNTALPGLTGALSLASEKLNFNVNWPILPGAQLQSKGDFNFAASPAPGEIFITVPQFTLSDGNAVGSLAPGLKNLQITGDVKIGGKFTFENGQTLPNINVQCGNVSVIDPSLGASITGLAANVTFTNLSPLETPGNQQISIKEAKIGKVVLDNGTAALRVEGTNSVLIERSQWAFADGTLLSNAFRISPGSGVTDLIVEGQNVSMQTLLETFLPGQATGDGRIYGSLPISVRWPNLQFGQGFVYSAPGGGTLQMPTAETKVGDLLDQSDPRFATDDAYKQLKTKVVSALHDFQYDVIKMDWTTGPDGLVTKVQLQGKGKQGGQAVNLNIKFTGLDKALMRYIINKDEG
jgi:hypothetical protein